MNREQLELEVGKLIHPADVVLDIGPGIRPQTKVAPKFWILAEPHYEYAKVMKDQFAGKNGVVLQVSALTAMSYLPDRSVDSVFCLDVIEHMQKEAGFSAIDQMRRVARKQVVIFTPLGFKPQAYKQGEKDAWGMDGVSWQTHRSGWTPADFPNFRCLVSPGYHGDFGAFYAILDVNN